MKNTEKNTEERIAKHGEKMIEIRVRFWTDGIAVEKNKIRPKCAWDTGVVVLDTNKSHGLTQHDPILFNSILELQGSIAKLLTREGVTLIPDTKLSKLIKPVE